MLITRARLHDSVLSAAASLAAASVTPLPTWPNETQQSSSSHTGDSWQIILAVNGWSGQEESMALRESEQIKKSLWL
jgi:hypothetical protein